MDKLVINEQEHEVDVADFSGGKGKIVVDGVTREVELLGVYADRVVLSVDGSTTTLFAAVTDRGTWIGSGGRARLVSRPARARRGAGGAGEGDRLITPTFPASVVKVLVQQGEQVDKGQAVVVVSAMKMEMTLTAPYAGTVSAVNFGEGDQVKPGDSLVDIEEGAEDA